MQRTLVKLLIAITLSLGCFGITHWIYVATAPKSGASAEREPIAFVAELQNDVQRRPLKRTIWQGLENGEAVYPGEAIRTASQSEARLQFAGNGKILDIEADSLIVLSASKDEVSLELLDGSIFVAQNENGTTEADQKLTLKSDAGAIDLSKATASLSKTQGQNVNLQVLKGAALLGSGQAIEQGQGGQLSESGAQMSALHLKILSPRTDGSPLFISGQNPTAQKFSWQGAPAEARVELWLGSSRKDLKSVATNSPGSSEISRIIPPGRFFWKLAVFSKTGAPLGESAIYRMESKALASIPVIRPKKDELLTLNNPSTPVSFEWSLPEKVSESTLEIAADKDFKRILMSEKFAAPQTRVERILKTGKYYWRLSAYYPEYREMIASTPLRFEVWVKPVKNIQISWQLNPILYYPLKPQADLRWTSSEDPDIKRWRVKVAPDKEALNAIEDRNRVQTEVESLEARLPLPKSGRWVASVEALDEKGEVLAKSSPQNFDLSVLPLLPAPRFLPETGDLQATPRGDLDLQWKATDGTRSFRVILKDTKGREIAARELPQVSTSLKNLMPGTYLIEIHAQDEYGRATEVAPPRRVLVPETSGLTAPKFKKVQVK